MQQVVTLFLPLSGLNCLQLHVGKKYKWFCDHQYLVQSTVGNGSCLRARSGREIYLPDLSPSLCWTESMAGRR